MNWLSRILMGLLGLMLLCALILGLCVYVVFATLRWLLTGRKPQMLLVWQQFQAMRGQFAGRGGFKANPSWGGATQDDQVLDVQAREVPDAKPHLPQQRP